MDYNEDDEGLLSSQIIEEEDLFFDDSHHDQDIPTKSPVNSSLVTPGTEHEFGHEHELDDTLRIRLAGPSTNKESHSAGLQAVDKNKINEIIYEISKGTPFFENERKKDAAVTERIDALLAKHEKIKNDDLSHELVVVDKMMKSLEEERDLTQHICHIDMDAFYASVHELDQPHLKNVPMAVGGMGMLCTSNYEARKFGVRSAMPGYIAVKLCPQLKIIPLNFTKYRAASAKVRAVFEKYDPHFCPMSLDEAYLNITNFLASTTKSPAEVVQEIRDLICEETGLTASAGIAANKTLAKICTDMNKPNGQFHLENNLNDIKDFVRPLSIRKIPGVGRVTERVLNALKVNTCGDIYPQRAMLYKLLSEVSFNFLLRAHMGLGSTSVDTQYVRKSMSVERTFRTLSSRTDLYIKLKDISRKLAQDLEGKNLCGKTIGLKIKLTSFEVRTRAKTLPSSIFKQEDIEKYAGQLLEKELPVSLRLMGVRLSSLNSRDEEEHKGVKRFFQPVSESKNTTDRQEGSPSKIQKVEIDNHNANAESTPETNDTVDPHNVLCPICQTKLNALDNQSVNEHIDSCNHNANTELTLETNGVVELQSVLCPICQTKLNALDNQLVNEHIDNCLNMPLVQHEMEYQSHNTNNNQRGASTGKAGLQSSKSLKDYFASGNISSIPK